MDKDRVEGGAKRAKGSVKQAGGKLTGNDRTEAEGSAEKSQGKVRGKVGRVKDAVRETFEKYLTDGVRGSLHPLSERRRGHPMTDNLISSPDRRLTEDASITPAEDARTIAVNEISWGAVLAGVVLTLVAQLLLNLLGVGIGVATLNPGTGDNPPASTFSIAAGIWYAAAGIVAAFIGGYFASRLSGRPVKSTGALHGVTTWAATTLVVLYLLTTAVGSLVGGAFSSVSNAVGGLGRTAADVAESAVPVLTDIADDAGDPFGAIERQIEDATGSTDPEVLRAAAIAAMREAFTRSGAQAEEARERAAQSLARVRNVPVEQARTQIQEWEVQYQAAVDAAQQQAAEAADAAAAVVARGALFGFISLGLGAAAGWFGGSAGIVAPTVTSGGASRRRF